MVTSAITFNRFGNNKSGFGSKLTLIDHLSRVCHCGSVRLCARHQAYVNDIVALTAVIGVRYCFHVIRSITSPTITESVGCVSLFLKYILPIHILVVFFSYNFKIILIGLLYIQDC